MLGHKGMSYSQAIAELGFQLMAIRLTAEQAVNVMRAFAISKSSPVDRDLSGYPNSHFNFF
jgi:hypothetical protein